MSKERIFYLDILRIVATFAVIMLHVAAQNWDMVPVNTSAWRSFNFYDAIVRWAVPVFVMMSGVLMLGSERSLSQIFQKNILRIVVAFCAWSAFYTLLRQFTEGGTALHFISRFLRGEYHLWFLYLIVGLYLVVPFLQKIVASVELSKYFLLLSLVFTILIPQAVSLVALFSEEAAGLIHNIITERMNFYFTLGYVGYFVLGYFLTHSRIGKRAELMIYLLGAGGFGLTIGGTAYLAGQTGLPNQLFYGYLTGNVLCESLAVFVFFQKHCSRGQKHVKMKKICAVGAEYSFGAYLSHVAVLMTLEHFGLTTLSFPPVLSVPAISILTFGISYFISFLLHRIPIVKEYLV